MKLIPLRSFLLIFALAFIGFSCDDSSSGVDNPESGSATFQGKVENTNSPKSTSTTAKTVEGAVVTAAYVNASGSLETFGNNEVQTNAEGEYTLQVDISAAADAANRIVIVAESEGETAKAFVGSNVENGSVITVQPISYESSAEAEVFQNVVADGNTDVITKADIELAVESDVAADIESNAGNAANVATALASSAEAKAEFYADKGIELSSEQREQIIQAKQNAQVQLASELDAATSTDGKQAAFGTFMEAMAKAELEANVAAWAVAESNDFAARMMLHQSAELSTEAQSEIRQHMYYATAVAVEAAVRAEAEVIEASDATINAIADAAATLRTEIKTTTNASKGAIDDLFVQFNESVQAAINSDTSLEGNAFVAANTAVDGSSNLKSTLESTLSASADLNTMLSAYTAFNAGIESLVNTTFADATDTEAEAYTNLLVLINIAS